MRRLPALIAVFAVVGLAGCAATPPATYDLALAGASMTAARSGASIVVADPTAVQTFASTRIPVRSDGGEISYLPDAQLTDTVTRVVQIKTLEAYQNAGIDKVGLPGDRLAADVALLMTVRTFEIDAADGGVAKVEISARLLHERSGRVLAAKVFSAEQPAPLDSAPAAVNGLDLALGQVLGDLVAWTGRVL